MKPGARVIRQIGDASVNTLMEMNAIITPGTAKTGALHHQMAMRADGRGQLPIPQSGPQVTQPADVI
jgi:hypothetical protein